MPTSYLSQKMPSQAKIYYDTDADLSVLEDKQIVFLGYFPFSSLI